MSEISQPQIAPIKQDQRIHFLDVLRGIAIQCIFMANIGFFSGLFFFPESARNANFMFVTDDILGLCSYMLIDGKFYSIFSLLFGIGCYMQYQKLQQTNKPFAPFFKRRMFWLLMFGLIHLMVFWQGDILTLYAVLGFALIPFINISNRRLLFFAGLLILLPILNWLVIHVLGIEYPKYFRLISIDIWVTNGFPQIKWGETTYNDFIFLLNNDSWLNLFVMNFGNAFLRLYSILEEGRIFKVLGIFLIGIWAGRKIINENLLENTKLLKSIALIGILIGLPMSAFRTYLEFIAEPSEMSSLLGTMSYAFGTVPFALGYAALIALIFKRKPKFLQWLAPAGKMAFTNYISHTLFGIIFFYGVGFGFAGQMGFTLITLIASGVFLAQVLFSTIWLRYFKYGPLEWLWRQLTYGKILKLKKTPIQEHFQSTSLE